MILSKVFYSLALFLWIGLPSYAHTDCSVTLSQLNHLIKRNRFQTRRDLAGYANYFPDSFLKQLGTLGKNGHWIDAGSGEGEAVKNFFDAELLKSYEDDYLFRPLSLRASEDKPQVTAVSYNMESDTPHQSKLHFKVGKYFEQIPTDEFAKADLITDLYGVASYSPRFDQVLSKYHEILKPGGKAYIFLGFVARPHSGNLEHAETREAPIVKSQVKLKNGETISLLDWAMSLPGFKATLESQGPSLSRMPIPTTLVLEKVSGQANIPYLMLKSSDLDTPPRRNYEEANLK